MRNPGCVTSCSAVPAAEPALHSCSATLIPEGNGAAPTLACCQLIHHPRECTIPCPWFFLGHISPEKIMLLGQAAQLAVRLNSHNITPALLSPSQPWQHPPSSILFPHSCPLVLFCDHGHTTGPSSTHWLIRYTFLFYSINEFYSLTIFSFSLPTTWISPIHVSPFFFINISPTFITFV